MYDVLTLLLSHQTAAELKPLLDTWREVAAPGHLLLAYGGTRENFEAIAFEPKLLSTDPALRTRDHQRERQSCTAVLRQAMNWMQDHPEIRFVHFTEYDHVPLVRDLYSRIIERMENETADVLAFHLRRIDGTSDAHYLHHAVEPRFHQFFRTITHRRDADVVLAMLGTGSFWRREAFEAVISRDEPFPIYFELYLPTLAHHLGYRLRDFADQNASVTNLGDFSGNLDEWRARGAWTAHPAKRIRSAAAVLGQR